MSAKEAKKGLPKRTGKLKARQPARFNRSEERRVARHQRQVDAAARNQKSTDPTPWQQAKAARFRRRHADTKQVRATPNSRLAAVT